MGRYPEHHQQFQVKYVAVTVNVLDVVYFCDVTRFQSDGYTNGQRHRIWSDVERHKPYMKIRCVVDRAS